MFLFSFVYGYFVCIKTTRNFIIRYIYHSLITLGSKAEGVSRVGNNYDQVQLRSIKMADTEHGEHGEFRQSRIAPTRHLVRRPNCA